MSKQASEFDLLSRTSELLSAGWCQGVSRSEHARCVMAALGDAARELGWHSGLLDGAFGRLARMIGRSVAQWNDEPGRTHAEVLALVVQAAAEARREGEK